MPATLDSIAQSVGQAATEITWQQWGAIGAQTNDARPHHQAAIDPEALLLMSLALLEHERRLADVITSWVALNSGLLSVQRARNLGPAFPPSVQQGLSAVATIAVREGKDFRWRSVLPPDEDSSLGARSGKVRAQQPPFLTTATLILQLRQGMGVGVKSDVLAFLLTCDGHGQEWASTTAMARALGYTSAAVRRNADELAIARFIRRMESVDSEQAAARMYMAEPANWGAPLHLGNIQQGWRYWRERFTFMADVLDTNRSLAAAGASEFAISVACKELCDKHRTALTRDTGLSRGALDDQPDGLLALNTASRLLIEWMRNNP